MLQLIVLSLLSFVHNSALTINNYLLHLRLKYYSYINQLNKFLDKKIIENEYKKLYIKSIDPPFSIQKICIIGEIFGRTCGEWFSDYELPRINTYISNTPPKSAVKELSIFK